MKVINHKNYFEIYKSDGEIVGRFMNLTIKNKEDILKDVSKKESKLVNQHYNEYVNSIKNHNKIIEKIEVLKHDKDNLNKIINLGKQIKTTNGYDILSDIIVRRYVFTGNFL